MYKKTYNPCDECKYSFSKQNEISGMCKICEFKNYIQADGPGAFARLPCKIGDTVWGIRRYKGIKHPQQGVVSEMYFLPGMSLQIVVKHICRGGFGEKIFLTREEAERALRERGSE